jgi:Uma2 family endonuclease
MSTIQIPTEQRFVFRHVDWPRYKAIAHSFGERYVRLAYDGWNLEIMTASHLHKRIANLISRFVGALTEELSLPMCSAGSTTFDREDVEKAVEPDQCYYLSNEAAIREKDELDLTIDPPPDLVIEVEISRSALNRIAIYAALRVPEVWRSDGTYIKVYLLGKDGQYAQSERSRHFPFLPIDALVNFLQKRTKMSETDLIRLFRAWVCDQVAKGWK